MSWEKMDDYLELSTHVRVRFERRKISGGYLVVAIRQGKTHDDTMWRDEGIKGLTFVPHTHPEPLDLPRVLTEAKDDGGKRGSKPAG